MFVADVYAGVQRISASAHLTARLDGPHAKTAHSQGGPRLSTSRGTSGGISEEHLRFSVQTLDGHVCDDEDEDSETDDG